MSDPSLAELLPPGMPEVTTDGLLVVNTGALAILVFSNNNRPAIAIKVPLPLIRPMLDDLNRMADQLEAAAGGPMPTPRDLLDRMVAMSAEVRGNG
jgi:hypothetical protein